MVKGQHKSQFVAVTMMDDSVRLLQFITEVCHFDKDSEEAKRQNLQPWTREATDVEILKEITDSGLTPNKGWVRIDEKDIPKDRSNRSSWKVNGKKIV
jgi:hypothetical protein